MLYLDRSLHPYCAASWDVFLSWNVGKRRAAEVRLTFLIIEEI
jgi:hypothetical protein